MLQHELPTAAAFRTHDGTAGGTTVDAGGDSADACCVRRDATACTYDASSRLTDASYAASARRPRRTSACMSCSWLTSASKAAARSSFSRRCSQPLDRAVDLAAQRRLPLAQLGLLRRALVAARVQRRERRLQRGELIREVALLGGDGVGVDGVGVFSAAAGSAVDLAVWMTLAVARLTWAVDVFIISRANCELGIARLVCSVQSPRPLQ